MSILTQCRQVLFEHKIFDNRTYRRKQKSATVLICYQMLNGFEEPPPQKQKQQ